MAHIYRLLAPAILSTHGSDEQQQQSAAELGQGEGAPFPIEASVEEDGVVSQSLDTEDTGGDLGAELSDRCADILTLMACRVCDPEVRERRGVAQYT